MSRWFSERLGRIPPTYEMIAVTAGAAAWFDASASMWVSMPWDPLAEAAQVCSGICRQSGRRAERAWWLMHASLVHEWLQEPPADVGSLTELHAVARVRADRLFSGVARERAQFWIDGDWRLDRPFRCSALPVDWARTAQAGALRTTSILRLLLRLRWRSMPRNGAMAVMLWDHAHLMAFLQGRLTCLAYVRLDREDSSVPVSQQIEARWRQEWLRMQAQERPPLDALSVIDLSSEASDAVGARTQAVLNHAKATTPMPSEHTTLARPGALRPAEQRALRLAVAGVELLEAGNRG